MPNDINSIPRRSALILYGTETGSSQDIAQEIDNLLQRLHFDTEIEEVDSVANHSLNHLSQYSLIVIALSTTGQGEFPSNARRFWSRLLRKSLKYGLLSGVTYALVGLCDSSYPKFNYAARKLDKRLKQLGASSLLVPCEADEQGEDGTEGAFLEWSRLLREEVLHRWPLLAGQDPIAETQRLPSRWILEEDVIEVAGRNLEPELLQQNPRAHLQASERAFTATLETNTRVTPREHWQDVRHMKLNTQEAVHYLPGDALAIQPQNMPEDVNNLLELLNWQDAADKCVRLRYNSSSHELFQPVRLVYREVGRPTIRSLLTNCLDINAIPRRSFFAAMSSYTDDPMQKERLLEFTDPQYLDEYFDYATRPRRSILEVLQEFHTVKPPWQEVTNLFPIMRPRQFSIASGGRLKSDGHTFELLVAIVRYRTIIKRIREGVCTRYLSQLTPGTTLNLTLHTEGRFHVQQSSLQRSHLLIGGGTGIAPLRSLIQERLMSTNASLATLVFGCRSLKADYFFVDEWDALKKHSIERDGHELRVLTAFSRDQKQKVYVQDRIREHSKELHKILMDGSSVVIVCGSSGQMPRAVRQALVDVIKSSPATDGSNPVDENEAELFLIRMEKEGRYKQETW